MSDFSTRLSALREQKGWSKTYVAKQIGLTSMQTYANYEYGRREPDFETTKKLANLFSFSTDYLLGRDPKEDDEKPLTRNQKLIAYSIDPDISDEERQAIIEMVQAAKKFRRRI